MKRIVVAAIKNALLSMLGLFSIIGLGSTTTSEAMIISYSVLGFVLMLASNISFLKTIYEVLTEKKVEGTNG